MQRRGPNILSSKVDMIFDDLKYRVHLKCNNTDTEHIDIWCEEHFGYRGGKWEVWFDNDSLFNFDLTYAFLNQEDAMLFTLRWA